MHRFAFIATVMTGLAASAVAAAPPRSDADVQLAQAKPAEPTMIWCLDPAGPTVLRKWPHDCHDRIVSDAEAKQVQDDLIRKRARAMRGHKPMFEGKQLVATGSGFVVSAAGHMLTNNHVIEGCAGVSVTPAVAEEAIIATVVAAEPSLDLALLKASSPLPTVGKFRDSVLPPASDIAVVGYPLHGRVVIKPIFVEGIVDAEGRSASPDRFVLSIDIRHGNSGGPVLDRSGNIVGVVVAKVDTPAVFARTGQVVRDIGIAIRPTVALDFLRQNGIAPVMTRSGDDLADDKLFDYARQIVGQVGCWK